MIEEMNKKRIEDQGKVIGELKKLCLRKAVEMQKKRGEEEQRKREAKEKPCHKKGAGSGGGKGRVGRRRENIRRREGVIRLVQISKTLMYVLRHKAQKLGVSIRSDGFCKLEEVLTLECS